MARAGGTGLAFLGVLGVAVITFGGLWFSERLSQPAPVVAPVSVSISAPAPAPSPDPSPAAVPAPAPFPGESSSPEGARALQGPLPPRDPRPRPAPSPGPRPDPAKAGPRDILPPPLEILEPAERSFLTRRPVTVRVRSEPGARVEAAGAIFQEGAAGLFAAELDLPAGTQPLVVSAADAAGNRRQAEVRVTVIDLERLEGERRRALGLLAKLEELRAVARDVDQRIGVLLSDLKVAPPEAIESLSVELRDVYRTRGELEREAERAIRELEATLGRGASP